MNKVLKLNEKFLVYIFNSNFYISCVKLFHLILLPHGNYSNFMLDEANNSRACTSISNRY